MALRMWASSTANALRISVAARPSLSLTSRCFSSVLEGLKYASSHEWVNHEGSVATVGITDHAQDHLGEALELLKVLKRRVILIHQSLERFWKPTPSLLNRLINTSPYEGGWMIKVKPSDPSDLDSLMGSSEYTKFCEEEDASH